MRSPRFAFAVSAALSFALTGCSTSFAPNTVAPATTANAAIQGRAQGGQQPIVGMKIYLYAAGTAGYNTASQSLLTGAGYVTTDSNGFFSITGAYTCPTGSTSYLYLYGIGGDAGAGVNSAATLMAPLGACAAGGNVATAVPYVWMNEVTTVVTAYSLAGWMTSPLKLATDNTTLANNGLATAFTTATNLEDVSTGTAYGAVAGLAYSSGGNAPQEAVNSLSNILAACVNSNGPASSACTGLFSKALSGGTTGTAPTDTATAIVNIAHNPTANVSTLYALGTAAAPFQPALGSAPSDWTLSRTLTVPNFNYTPTTLGLSADGVGNIGFFTSYTYIGSYGLLTPNNTEPLGGYGGVPAYGITLSPNSTLVVDSGNSTSASDLFGYSYSGSSQTDCHVYYNASFQQVNYPALSSFQYDSAGLVWAITAGASNTVFQIPGTISSTDCYHPNLYTASVNLPVDIAADASGNVWLANQGANNLLKLASNGTPTAYSNAGFAGIAHIAVGAAAEVITAGSATSLTTRSSAGTITSECSGLAKRSLAIDGANARWMVNASDQLEFCPAGAAVSTILAPPINSANSVRSTVIDAAGNVWILGATFTEVIGAATPPTLPLGTAAATNKIGTRP